MKTVLLIAIATVTADAADHWKFDEHQSISKTFSMNANPKLSVDNVSGFVHVTGYLGKEIKISADIRYRAEDAESLAEIKRDLKVDMSQQSNTARIYVDGPFRNNHGSHQDNGNRYQVNVEFEIQVPTATEVTLKCVNGATNLRSTTGDFDVHEVNGAVSLDQVSGSGMVNTVNGQLSAHFLRNPSRPTSFKTVNGQIEAYFAQPLSADLRFKTLNGEVYTDFPVTALSGSDAEAEQRNGKYVYKNNRMARGRAGQGGPELSFDTLNGNIRLRTK